MSYTKLEVPFTPQQVIDLNKWQQAGVVHPFTCGNEDKTDDDHPDRGCLVATINGWICPFCDYTQGWAHSFMADNAAREEMIEAISDIIKMKDDEKQDN